MDRDTLQPDNKRLEWLYRKKTVEGQYESAARLLDNDSLIGQILLRCWAIIICNLCFVLTTIPVVTGHLLLKKSAEASAEAFCRSDILSWIMIGLCVSIRCEQIGGLQVRPTIAGGKGEKRS